MKKLIGLLLLFPLLAQGQEEKEVGKFSVGFFGNVYNRDQSKMAFPTFDTIGLSVQTNEYIRNFSFRPTIEYRINENKSVGAYIQYGNRKRRFEYIFNYPDLITNIWHSEFIGGGFFYKNVFSDRWKINFFVQPHLQYLYEKREDVYSGDYLSNQHIVIAGVDLGMHYNINKNLRLLFYLSVLDFSLELSKEQISGQATQKIVLEGEGFRYTDFYLGVQYTFNKRAK